MIIAGLSAEARAMEVGAGTGIATKPLVRRGLSGDSERTRCRDGLGGKGRGGLSLHALVSARRRHAYSWLTRSSRTSSAGWIRVRSATDMPA